ncbi:MAG: peptidylprolyl isomerase [Pseudomonadota bacterium]
MNKPLITALISSLMALASVSANALQNLDSVVAIANNGIITESQVQKRISALRKSNVRSPDIRSTALEQIVLETIQMQIAKRANINVSDDQVNKTIADIAQQRRKSIESLKSELKQQNVPFKQFFEDTRRNLILQRVQHGSLRDKINITDRDVENHLTTTHGKKINATQYRVLNILLPGKKTKNNKLFIESLRSSLMKGEVSLKAIVKKQRFDDRKVKVSDTGWVTQNDLPESFQNVITQLKKNEISRSVASRDGYHVLMLVGKKTQKNTFNTQYLAQHILVKKTNIRSERSAEELAGSIHQRLIQGENFSTLAQLYSDDKGSAVEGGKLGWANADKYVGEFGSALKRLQRNQISQPVKTQFGWHIIQLLDSRKVNATEGLLKEAARQQIYKQQFTDALDNWLKKIRAEAFVEYK